MVMPPSELMSHFSPWFAGVLGLLLLMPTEALGLQQEPPIRAGDQVQLITEQLGPDWARGLVTLVQTDRLRLLHERTAFDIRFEAIRALQVRKRPASLARAAVLYGVAGASMGAALIGLSNALCRATCTVPTWKVVAVVGGATGLVSAGGVLAQMAGNARRPWFSVYPDELLNGTGDAASSLLRFRF